MPNLCNVRFGEKTREWMMRNCLVYRDMVRTVNSTPWLHPCVCWLDDRLDWCVVDVRAHIHKHHTQTRTRRHARTHTHARTQTHTYTLCDTSNSCPYFPNLPTHFRPLIYMSASFLNNFPSSLKTWVTRSSWLSLSFRITSASFLTFHLQNHDKISLTRERKVSLQLLIFI